MLIRHQLVAAFVGLIVLGNASAKAPGSDPVEARQIGETTRSQPAHADLMRFLLQQVDDPNQLRGYRVAILAADGVDGFDLEVPRNFLAQRGARVDIIIPRPPVLHATGSGAVIAPKTEITMLNPSGEADSSAFDRFLDQVRADDYDVIYLPGQRTLPSGLNEAHTFAFLQAAVRTGKSIFATGNSPLVLLNAGLLDRRRATGDPATQIELAASSATADDAPLVDDGIIHTSRDAFDMPVLIDRLIATLLAQPAKQNQ